MIWRGWQAFFGMGGYALYVWGSIVVFAIAIAVELIGLKVRRKGLLAVHGGGADAALPDGPQQTSDPAAHR